MSLKSFHLFFIVISILAAFGVSYWAFDNYQAAKDSTFLKLAILSAGGGVVLVVYGFYFVKKASRIIE
jgi:hypothetical protein